MAELQQKVLCDKLWEFVAINSTFCDVNLDTANGVIAAHRVILGASSPILQATFQQPEHRNDALIHLPLQGFRQDTCLRMLKYIYRGEMPTAPNDLNSFTKLAAQWRVKIPASGIIAASAKSISKTVIVLGPGGLNTSGNMDDRLREVHIARAAKKVKLVNKKTQANIPVKKVLSLRPLEQTEYKPPKRKKVKWLKHSKIDWKKNSDTFLIPEFPFGAEHDLDLKVDQSESIGATISKILRKVRADEDLTSISLEAPFPEFDDFGNDDGTDFAVLDPLTENSGDVRLVDTNPDILQAGDPSLDDSICVIFDHPYAMKEEPNDEQLKEQEKTTMTINNHATEDNLALQPVIPLSCPLCPNKFLDQNKLTIHRNSYRHKTLENMTCDICNLTFTIRNLFLAHNFEEHYEEGIEPPLVFKCKDPDCTWTTYKPKMRYVHYGREHQIQKHTPAICDLCGKTFKHKKSLDTHKANVHNNREITCEYCGKVYAKKLSYQSHLRQKHMEEAGRIAMICKLCNFIGYNQASIDAHLKNTHNVISNGTKGFEARTLTESDYNIVCENCGQKFLQEAQLKLHTCFKTPGVDRRRRVPIDPSRVPDIICDICDKGFFNKKALYSHKISQHRARKKQCSQCTFTYKYSMDQREHFLKQHPEMVLSCDVCNFKGINDFSLKLHKKFMHNISMPKKPPKPKIGRRQRQNVVLPALCPICGRVFTTHQAFSKHMSNHKRKPSTLSSLKRRIKLPPGTKEMCEECGKVFNMKVHRRVHQRKNKCVPQTCHICDKVIRQAKSMQQHLDSHNPTTKIDCDLCGQTVYGNLAMTDHKRKHRKDPLYRKTNIRCTICGLNCETRKVYSKHMFATHKTEPDRCAFCKFTTLKFGALKKHLLACHEEELPHNHKCGKCEFSCHYKSDYARHVRDEHAGKPQQRNDRRRENAKCPVCGNMVRKFWLKAHIEACRTQSDDQSATCGVCGFISKTKSGMACHMYKHKQEPDRCELCGFTTMEYGGLKKHRREVHEEKVYKCTECTYSTPYKVEMLHHQNRQHPGVAFPPLSLGPGNKPQARKRPATTPIKTTRTKRPTRGEDPDWLPPDEFETVTPLPSSHGNLFITSPSPSRPVAQSFSGQSSSLYTTSLIGQSSSVYSSPRAGPSSSLYTSSPSAAAGPSQTLYRPGQTFMLKEGKLVPYNVRPSENETQQAIEQLLTQTVEFDGEIVVHMDGQDLDLLAVSEAL